jgi:hypothetical protein
MRSPRARVDSAEVPRIPSRSCKTVLRKAMVLAKPSNRKLLESAKLQVELHKASPLLFARGKSVRNLQYVLYHSTYSAILFLRTVNGNVPGILAPFVL